MKAISGKDFARLLEKKGWELKSTKGSHHIYAKVGNPARISVLYMETARSKLAC